MSSVEKLLGNSSFSSVSLSVDAKDYHCLKQIGNVKKIGFTLTFFSIVVSLMLKLAIK